MSYYGSQQAKINNWIEVLGMRMQQPTTPQSNFNFNKNNYNKNAVNDIFKPQSSQSMNYRKQMMTSEPMMHMSEREIDSLAFKNALYDKLNSNKYYQYEQHQNHYNKNKTSEPVDFFNIPSSQSKYAPNTDIPDTEQFYMALVAYGNEPERPLTDNNDNILNNLVQQLNNNGNVNNGNNGILETIANSQLDDNTEELLKKIKNSNQLGGLGYEPTYSTISGQTTNFMSGVDKFSNSVMGNINTGVDKTNDYLQSSK